MKYSMAKMFVKIINTINVNVKANLQYEAEISVKIGSISIEGCRRQYLSLFNGVAAHGLVWRKCATDIVSAKKANNVKVTMKSNLAA